MHCDLVREGLPDQPRRRQASQSLTSPTESDVRKRSIWASGAASGDIRCMSAVTGPTCRNKSGRASRSSPSSQSSSPRFRSLWLRAGRRQPAPVVSGITAGTHHACAIVGHFDGAVCCGTNYSGQLGNGSRPRAASTPVALPGLALGVKAISAGAYHTCALTRAGGVKCWGYNRSGQLGNGSTVNSRVPVDVRGLTSGVKAVAAG